MIGSQVNSGSYLYTYIRYTEIHLSEEDICQLFIPKEYSEQVSEPKGVLETLF